jgi:hypothetical protein
MPRQGETISVSQLRLVTNQEIYFPSPTNKGYFESILPANVIKWYGQREWNINYDGIEFDCNLEPEIVRALEERGIETTRRQDVIDAFCGAGG